MERPRRDDDDRPIQARVTLPPPEWSKANAGSRPQSDAPSPVSHQTGARADEAALRVRVEEARASSESEAERIASVELARWLASRDRELDEAAQLALRAVRIQDDPELRVELAGWLESLGEAGLAAAMLRPTMPDDDDDEREDDPLAARRLVRVGVLHARAGDAAGASEALEDAAKADRTAAIPLELRGTLASWAPEVVSASSAADAYVESAARRAAIGEDSLEDLLRAFETDPASENAATALATALGARGKGLAADEVTREHGCALTRVDAPSGKAVHARRRSEALAVGDVARALGAAFDEGLDSVLLGEAATTLNELLVRAGLLEPLAARLEAAAERAEKIDKGRLYETLARLSGGPLAQPSRAAHAYAALLRHKPASEEARAALLGLASEVGDPSAISAAIAAGDWDGLRARVRDHFRGRGAFGPGLDTETEARLERANDERASGSYAGANDLTRELATRSSRLASLAWTHAVLAGDSKAAGIAIERVAADASPNV
ncbi:MAG: Translation initiation factor 2, partial [Myxococcaceae bacterium]|nr:Translation initiation factor 2 [Myxococcaceae bacterium]